MDVVMNRLLPKYWAYQRLSILPIARDSHYFQIIYMKVTHIHINWKVIRGASVIRVKT